MTLVANLGPVANASIPVLCHVMSCYTIFRCNWIIVCKNCFHTVIYPLHYQNFVSSFLSIIIITSIAFFVNFFLRGSIILKFFVDWIVSCKMNLVLYFLKSIAVHHMETQLTDRSSSSDQYIFSLDKEWYPLRNKIPKDVFNSFIFIVKTYFFLPSKL